MNRRDFCKKAIIPPLSLAAGSLITGCEQSGLGNTTRYSGRRLIIIRLDGGHDAIYTYAPTRHDLLQKLRPNLYTSTSKDGIHIGDWILNPAWKILYELMLSGDARIIPNVGYPLASWTGSHFSSADIWESGLLPGEATNTTGWIGRLLDKQVFNPSQITWPVINLDGQPHMFDQGVTHTGISWMGSDSYAVIRKYAQEYYRTYRNIDEEEYKTFLLHERVAELQPTGGYSQSSLGNQLSYAESMIHEDIPVSVLHITQHGYDTHTKTEEQLPKLQLDLLQNLNLFVKRLKFSSHWSQTQIFIYSEFGRTLDENADGGTDHGMAGHVFTLGGINLFNTAPFISQPQFDIHKISDNHYLKYQIDFREILGRYEREWLI